MDIDRWKLLAIGFILLNILGYWRAFEDKRQSRHDGWRVPEASFYLLALLGAWSGILLAMLAYHHKTRKKSFQVVFVVMAFANISLLTTIAYLFGFRVPNIPRIYPDLDLSVVFSTTQGLALAGILILVVGIWLGLSVGRARRNKRRSRGVSSGHRTPSSRRRQTAREQKRGTPRSQTHSPRPRRRAKP